MLHDSLVGVLADHGGQFVIARIGVVVEVGDDGGELFLGLLVEVRNSNTSSEDCIVGVSDSHVCSSLCSL